MDTPDSTLTKIGVFFDGGYFKVVSDYYRYVHSRRARLSVDGVLEFARAKTAEFERIDPAYCRVVDSHYFRGRYSIQSLLERAGALEHERRFDDLLMRAGITTHYLPRNPSGEEKGIDVWLALEAYELAVYKRFNVLVLLASDSDYVPLIRKLSTLGTRVMLLAWDFKYTDQNGNERETRTSQALLEEVTYPIMMHDIIDDRSKKADAVVNGLFWHPTPRAATKPEGGERSPTLVDDAETEEVPDGEVRKGKVNRIKEGYGFITDATDSKSRFFHHSAVRDDLFDSLGVGDEVEFIPVEDGKNGKAVSVRLLKA